MERGGHGREVGGGGGTAGYIVLVVFEYSTRHEDRRGWLTVQRMVAQYPAMQPWGQSN